MTLVGNYDKAPSEVLDYEIDLSDVVGGDSIRQVGWTSSLPYELVVGNGRNGLPAPTQRGAVVKCWVGGGVPGRYYTVHASVSTSGGRVYSRGFGVKISDDRASHASALGAVSAGSPTSSALRAALVCALVLPPGLWVAGQALGIPGLRGMRLVGTAVVATGGVALGMLLWAAFRGRSTQSTPMMSNEPAMSLPATTLPVLNAPVAQSPAMSGFGGQRAWG